MGGMCTQGVELVVVVVVKGERGARPCCVGVGVGENGVALKEGGPVKTWEMVCVCVVEGGGGGRGVCGVCVVIMSVVIVTCNYIFYFNFT